jgi:hypothetical protein
MLSKSEGEASREGGSVWRLQAAAHDLARGLIACALPANALIVPEATLVQQLDQGYVEAPSFFVPDRAGFVAVLAYMVGRGHSFRLMVRAASGEAEGLLLAYPRLDPGTLELLRRFDALGAQQINDLCRRLESFLVGLASWQAENLASIKETEL